MGRFPILVPSTNRSTHHQQVQNRTAEIKTLHQTIADKDAAYVTLQGVAAKHFEQLHEPTRLLNSTSDPALRHAQAVVKDQQAVILRQKRIIQRQGCLPLHEPHMAAAAGAGLDVPGLNPADLKLNARLCRLLEMRFPEVMNIPAGESRRVELTIHHRQDGSATSPFVSMSSAVAPIASPEAPVASGPAASGPASSASFLQRSLRTLNQLRRARLSTLTPKEQLRRYANPKSLMTAGSRRRTSAPPPQPYACPLPGEEGGHEEISALLGLNLPQETMSDGEGLHSVKASRRTRRRKTRRLQLSSATRPTISAFSENNATGLSDSAYEFEVHSTSDSAGPVNSAPDAIVSAAIGAASMTVSGGTVQTTPAVTPSSVLVVSTGQSPPSSGTPGLLQLGHQGFWRLIRVELLSPDFCRTRVPASSVAASRAPSSQRQAPRDSMTTMVVTNILTTISTGSRPSLPGPTTALTSPSGRPLRMSAANARTMTVQLLEDMDASDDAVLGTGNPSSNSADSASLAAGTSHDPIFLSEGSDGSPEPAQGDDVNLAPTSDSASEESPSSHRKRPHSQVFGSDDESDDESSQPSSRALSCATRGVLPPLGKTRCLRVARRSLYDSDDGAGSSASAAKSRRHKRRAPSSPDSHRKSKKHKKHKRHQSQDPFAHSILAPSSSTSVAAPFPSSPTPLSSVPPSSSVPVTSAANLAARSPPVPLPVALRLSLSALRIRASQAVSKDSRMSAQMARLRDIPFFHFGSARCWSATLECQTSQVHLEPADGKDRVPPTPCSLVNLRAFTSVFSSTHPCQRLRRMLPELPFFFSLAVFEEDRQREAPQTRLRP
ncbi:hypothetical protein PI124_g19974 [Phytophthora idaei]|nr:hypothetical protein PI124_g19974 [Phytophthora idaei]